VSKSAIVLAAFVAIGISILVGQNSIFRVVWPIAIVTIGGCVIHTLNARLFPAKPDLDCRNHY
jgi:hypothetical protein